MDEISFSLQIVLKYYGLTAPLSSPLGVVSPPTHIANKGRK